MKVKTLSLLVLLMAMLSSCNSVYFTEPQPVNSKNIYEFPAKYLGIWMEGEDTIMISKNVYRSVSYRDETLLKSEADTSSKHILANGKIYFIQKDDRVKLIGGYPYILSNDTIIYKNREVIEVFLGGNTFLRKVSSRYLLNIKSDELWWELVLIEKSKEGNVIGRRLANEDMEVFGDKHLIWKGDNMSYYDLKWEEKDLTEIIKTGSFSDTIINLSPDSKIRKRKNIR